MLTRHKPSVVLSMLHSVLIAWFGCPALRWQQLQSMLLVVVSTSNDCEVRLIFSGFGTLAQSKYVGVSFAAVAVLLPSRVWLVMFLQYMQTHAFATPLCHRPTVSAGVVLCCAARSQPSLRMHVAAQPLVMGQAVIQRCILLCGHC